jgi:glutathione synthase
MSFGSEQDLALQDLDVILMRKDPPFDTEFIYATYILERAEVKRHAGIVNKPQSLRDCNEKLFTAWFPELTPDTLVSSQFAAQHPQSLPPSSTATCDPQTAGRHGWRVDLPS